MSNTFKLSDYYEKVEQSYPSYRVDIGDDVVVELKNPLRVNEDNRARVFAITEELAEVFKSAEPGDGNGKWAEVGNDEEPALGMEEVSRLQPLMCEMLLLVGDENAGKLVDMIKHDMAVLIDVYQDYFTAVGLGEASVSED